MKHTYLQITFRYSNYMKNIYFNKTPFLNYYSFLVTLVQYKLKHVNVI